MMDWKEIDLVLSGSGTLIPCHLGAIARLQAQGYKIKRIAGTSGGAIVAAGIAYKFDVSDLLDLSKELLTGGKMLDPQVKIWKPWGFFNGYGVNAFDRLHKEMRTRFNGALSGKLEDADLEWGVFVADLETRKPVFLHSKRHQYVKTADAVVASASIPFFARARRVKNVQGYFVDGGLATNFGLGVWDDDDSRPTVGIRFKSTAGGQSRPIRNIGDFVRSVLEICLNLINRTYISKKLYSYVIEIDSKGSSLDFDLTEDQVTEMYQEGWDAAEEWIENQK